MTNFPYTPEVKKQAKNPFAKMTEATKRRCHLELRKRLFWLAQLGSSLDKQDKEFYHAFAKDADSMFGRAPEYDNATNTGMAVLAGAVEKLYAGDLSIKQIKYITPVLDAMNAYYPKLWDKIVFVEQEHEEPAETTFENLFDA